MRTVLIIGLSFGGRHHTIYAHFDALSAAAAESTIKSVKLVVMGEPTEKTSERKGASMLHVHFHTNESALLHSEMQKRVKQSNCSQKRNCHNVVLVLHPC